MRRTPALAALPSVIGGPGLDFTGGASPAAGASAMASSLTLNRGCVTFFVPRLVRSMNAAKLFEFFV
jgi:hypothetical protein